MAQLKTKENDGDVMAFIDAVEHRQRREDALTLVSIMQRLTGKEPRMWGNSIIGFGHYPYIYKNGKQIDWFRIGFSPRKQALSLYIMAGFKSIEEILKRMGKHKKSKGCLYIKTLEDVNHDVLEEMLQASLNHLEELFPEKLDS